MEVALTPEYLLALGSLSLLSIADLRDRSLPGIWIFFWGSVLFGIFRDPISGIIQMLLVLLVVWWGSWRGLPTLVVLPAIFLPTVWPVLLVAGGVRRRLVAQGDLLALGAITCLLPWQGSVFALLGTVTWKELCRSRNGTTFPALVGMLIGIVVTLSVRKYF